MKKGDLVFVRIDSRISHNEFQEGDFQNHIEYLTNISKQREFIGGGFEKEPGGMIVFKAKDIIEAKKICDNDPLILKKLYSYKLYEWNIVLLSK